MSNLTIYNVHHKVPQWCAHDEVFKPFIVGGETRGGFLSDDWGDNIRDQHSFAEMRCHYHVWQNRIDFLQNGDDYVGFQHYRRQFLWTPRAPTVVRVTHPSPEYYKFCAPSGALVRRLMPDCDIIAAKRIRAEPLLGDDYARSHRSEDWQAFYEHLAPAEQGIACVCNWINVGNMFIMRIELFDEYMCAWWGVLSQVAQDITPPTEGYQSRTLGFLSERYFTIWLELKRRECPNLRVLELPILIGQFQDI